MTRCQHQNYPRLYGCKICGIKGVKGIAVVCEMCGEQLEGDQTLCAACKERVDKEEGTP